MRTIMKTPVWLLSLALVILILSACAPASTGPIDEGTESPSTASDLVFVRLSAPAFDSGQMIEISIQNGMDKPIYTEDMKSDCTIIFLERWDGAAWQQIPGCNQRRAPAIVKIEPGQDYPVTIDPASPNFETSPNASTPATVSGTYRIRLNYRLEAEPEGEGPYSAFSESFTLGRELSGQITIEPQTTAAEAGQPTAQVGEPMEATSGQVAVTLGGASFTIGEAIEVAVSNGLDQTLYTADMKTGCTIVTLEKWEADAWQAVAGCPMRRAPMVMSLAPGHGYTLSLDPASDLFGGGPQAPAFGEGSYRIWFSYRLEPGPEGEEPLSAYSQEFKILP